MPMTRHDIILKWISYLAAMVLVAVVNYYVLGPLPIALPLLLPILAVAGGTLEGASFGAVYGGVCWAAGLTTQYVLRRDVWGHLICSVITALAWELGSLALHLLARTAPLPVLLRVAGPELLWTLVFILPVYWAGRFCCVNYGRIYHE